MIAVILAMCAGGGVGLLLNARAAPSTGRDLVSRRGPSLDRWLVEAGLGEVRKAEFGVVVAAVAFGGALVGWLLFASPLPAVVSALFAAGSLIGSYRNRRQHRIAVAQDHWPALIEEIRVLLVSSGRSIPQALFEVGARAPIQMRPAFVAAHRTWLLGADLKRALAVLKERLADSTADIVCETLLVASEVGGTDLDRRLAALADDRATDTHARKDARSRQAGARFARQFVLLVPIGMALAGMSVGNGRAAYRTPIGQGLAGTGIALVVACWLWAGRILRLPPEARTFADAPSRVDDHRRSSARAGS